MAARHASTVLLGDTVTVDSTAVLSTKMYCSRTMLLCALSSSGSGQGVRHVMSKDLCGRDSISRWMQHFSYGVFASIASWFEGFCML